MDLPEITAAEIAAFDQAFASSSELLDGLLEAHRTNVDRIVAQGSPEEAAIVGLNYCLSEDLSFGLAVCALTVAIVRIDRALRVVR